MPRQQRAIATRARLIEAAAELFAAHGYQGTRIIDIARNAQVAPGAMQFHFPTKADTARAVIAAQHELMIAAGTTVREADLDSGVEEMIVISGKVAALIDANPIVRAGIRLTTETEEFASADPYLEWTRFALGPVRRAAREGELSSRLSEEAFAEVLAAAFTGARYFSLATGEGGLVPLLAKMWAAIFPRVGGRECTHEVVLEIFERHGIISR